MTVDNFTMHVPSKIRFAGVMLATLAISGTISSCQKKIEDVILEKTIEHSTGKKVDINSGGQNITIQSEGQKIEIQGNGGVWPADMPADVPKFSWGQIKAVTRSETPEGKSWSVVCEKVTGNIVKEFESQLKSKGFKNISTIVTSGEGEGGVVSGEKEKLKVVLMTGNGSASLSVVKEP
jgi:hypothetical protein